MVKNLPVLRAAVNLTQKQLGESWGLVDRLSWLLRTGESVDLKLVFSNGLRV